MSTNGCGRAGGKDTVVKRGIFVVEEIAKAQAEASPSYVHALIVWSFSEERKQKRVRTSKHVIGFTHPSPTRFLSVELQRSKMIWSNKVDITKGGGKIYILLCTGEANQRMTD